MFDATIGIRNKEAYRQFWKRYKRPPIKAFQDYIIERRDLLVPQDIRERKGAFFTPRKWVELSQKYLADALGENWQDEYYVWDCAAGTGNLLAGLTNKYNIWASTLDQADVNVMHERINHGANLLDTHVFQFDFLNDDFSKLPPGLQDIINDETKRCKLVIYINPPYAEAGNIKQRTGTGENKANTAIGNKIHQKYKGKIGKAGNELFTQFLTRIYAEIPNSKIANFSKLKNLQSSNFKDFRDFFRAKLERIFLVPADTFDNVKGKFPIGFFIFDTAINEKFEFASTDVFNREADFIGNKSVYCYDNYLFINKWIVTYKNKGNDKVCTLVTDVGDFQNQNQVYLFNNTEPVKGHKIIIDVNLKNIIPICVYYSVRHCIEATWLNDRDQFLYPNDNWKTDTEFQNDCLAFTLFDNSNNISTKFGVNHWIPFTEQEVNAKEKFASNFMTDFINGKLKAEQSNGLLFDENAEIKIYDNQPRRFSDEAAAVFNHGRELWKYYHQQPGANVNASLYDIREYFQGRNDQGRMNSRSIDETYTKLIGGLRGKLNVLADKITPKIYEYEFLKE